MAYKGTYRTKSGQNYFGFSYESQPSGEVRAYIESQPSYQGRPTGGHDTHRYYDGRNYICMGNCPPTNLSDAIAYSKAWAERTERYIRTGKEINEG
ncbi:MAG: hypothetical protein KF777_17355 [Planctomycetaceae bacterium]|nr:hypothetical protein [Planctomycetaceae bacterium]